MPLRDRIDRAKRKAKDYLGVGSDSLSSTSSPSLISSNPNSAPQTIRRAGTPLLQSTEAPRTARSSFTADALASNTISLTPFLTPVGVAPTSAIVPGGQIPGLSSSPPGAVDTSIIAVANDQQRTQSFAWSGLKTLLKVVASSSDVFPPLKSAVGGLNKCIGILEDASKGRKEYQELQKKIDSLLVDLSRHIGGTTSAKMTMGVQNLCMGLNEELELVQDKSARGVLQTHAEALDEPNEIAECYRRIQGHLERLTLNANLSIWKAVDELTLIGLMNMQDAHLQRLSPITSAVYNSAESGKIQRRACTKGTRHSELKTLLDWARNRHGGLEEVYWMNGMAGTGKTTIAYSLCAELEKSAELGASFFCSRLIPECRDVTLIIPSIAYQLALFSCPFRFALSKVLEGDPSVHTRALRPQFEILLLKPLLEVKPALPAHFVVVIDALDECDNENSIAEILELLLAHTLDTGLPIRFLLSSRPEREIYYRMMARVGKDSTCRLVLHDLDVGVVKGDIATYIQDELNGAGLADSQLALLSEQCGVLFIYASTAARYIRDGIELEEQEDRLNMILGLTPASPDGKDRGIDSLYGTVLQMAFKKPHLDESGRKRTKLLLDTIICIQEPMTVDGLAGLLKLRSGRQVEGLVRPLSSVLSISELDKLVTTLHASFPDYMRDIARSDVFHCSVPSNHTRLARTCFDAIRTSQPVINICGLPSSYQRDDEVNGLSARVEASVPPWLFYACRYWMAHVELSEKQDEMGTLLHGFLSTNLLFWIEALNLKKSISLGSDMMQRAKNWSTAYSRPEAEVELAHDAWRFVTMYTSHAVSQSTPHLYISMLSFWPEPAPITEHYTKRLRGPIQVHGSAMTRRQLALLATWLLGGSVYSISLSPDETLMACAVDSSIWIIDGTTGRAVWGPLEHGGRVNSVAFSPDGALLVSSSNDKTVKVWQTNNGQLYIEPLEGHTNLVNSATFSPDGKRVISGSPDSTIRVWSLETGRMVFGPLQGHNNEVWSISVSTDGSRIASAHGDGSIQVWSADSGQMVLGQFTGHTNCVRSVCFSPDGMRLASGADDNTIRLWSNLNSQVHADVLEGHARPVYSVDFSPNGKQLVSGSDDFTVRLWDIQDTPQLARVFTGHTNTVFCVWFSSDSARIVSSSGDRTIRVWDARSQGPAEGPLEGHTDAVTSVAFSHGGSRIVSGSNDGTIYVWDRQSGQVAVGPMKGHSDWVRSLCVSPDGARVASGSRDKTIQLWDAYTGQAVGKPLTGHSGEVLSVCFSPDGTLLASGSADKTIRLWNADSGEPFGSAFRVHTSYVVSVHFSPNSLRLVSGSDDKTVLIWNVSTREPVLPPLNGHTDWVWVVCVSPDGTRIASGSEDTTVRLWDANDGQSVFSPLTGHTAPVWSVGFSPNSDYVISGSDDKTIRLWDARSGQAVGSPLVGHTGRVRSVAFSPDGRQIVSGSEDETIRVWDIADLVQPREPKDDIHKGTEPSHANQSWVMQNDGWVIDPQSRLLAWVPPNLHASLMNPRNPLLISTKGSVQLELESAKLGESWTECFQPTD